MPKGFVLKQGLVRDFDKQTISHSRPDGTYDIFCTWLLFKGKDSVLELEYIQN